MLEIMAFPVHLFATVVAGQRRAASPCQSRVVLTATEYFGARYSIGRRQLFHHYPGFILVCVLGNFKVDVTVTNSSTLRKHSWRTRALIMEFASGSWGLGWNEQVLRSAQDSINGFERSLQFYPRRWALQ